MWQETLKVNVDGAFLCAQAVGKHLIDTGRPGSIIQTASIYGAMAPDFNIYQGLSDQAGNPMGVPAVYTTSKAALIGLTKHLASYWAQHGIRVNNIIPGGVEHGQQQKFIENYSRRIPLNRMATQKDLIGALIFLASDASAYITGLDIYVDGGLHIL